MAKQVVGFGGIVAGKFEVYEDRAGKFRFRLKAANGEVIAVGEAFETRQAAHEGAEAVMREALGAPLEDLVR